MKILFNPLRILVKSLLGENLLLKLWKRIKVFLENLKIENFNPPTGHTTTFNRGTCTMTKRRKTDLTIPKPSEVFSGKIVQLTQLITVKLLKKVCPS